MDCQEKFNIILAQHAYLISQSVYDYFPGKKKRRAPEKSVNMMMIDILYQIILILGDSVLLGGLKLVYEVLDIYGVDAKILECRSDG